MTGLSADLPESERLRRAKQIARGAWMRVWLLCMTLLILVGMVLFVSYRQLVPWQIGLWVGVGLFMAGVLLLAARLYIRQLVQVVLQAAQADDAKTHFLANMSHELRTPLNAIIGFSETLGMGLYGPLTPKQLEYVGDIHRAGKHLLRIVVDLLDLSVIDSGAMVLREAEVALPAVVEEALALVRPSAEEAGVSLTFSAPEGLPKVFVDAVKMQQILVNLLANALKFSQPEGQVEVDLQRTPEGLLLRVIDHGEGIKPEELEQVLSPFGKSKSAYARSHGGVGLGLPLARRLAELHGGTLSIDSTYKVGTTVSLFLPAKRLVG